MEPVPTKSKILLFGRTGSGKSTVANMLIRGNLNPPLLFPTSPGVRGMTMTFQTEESDNWKVVDTIGYGEGEHGSILDAEARNKLYDFFVGNFSQDESYNYYAYVHKWGKLDTLDARVWSFFKQAFDGASGNFIIIFTHCSEAVLEDNLIDVKVAFPECERYIVVDFPEIGTLAGASAGAEIRILRNEMNRETSFKRLHKSLQEFMKPPISLCLRSSLKNGRILVMGTATKARNMVAKLLVDGTISMTSEAGVDGMALNGVGTNGDDDEDKSRVFEELEGRRWQIVNALAFDSAGIGDIYGSSDCLDQDKATTAASKLLASNFLTILEHGLYSHLVYVEESGKMPTASKALLQEILKARKWKSFKTIAVIVSYGVTEAQVKVPNRFKELTTVCEIRLPNFCASTETESHGNILQRCALATLEETIFQGIPYLFWHPIREVYRNSIGGPGYDQRVAIESIANSVTFKVLVYAHLKELQPGMKKSWSSLVKTLLSKIHLGNGEVDLLECGSNFRTVLRMPSKHIAVQVACQWDIRGLLTKYLLIVTKGEKKSLREGLEKDFIWGELQAVDKHHVDRKLARIPLAVGSYSKKIKSADIWIVGARGVDVMEREFLENLSIGDTVILWMYPHPNPKVPHENKFEVDLHFRDFGH